MAGRSSQADNRGSDFLGFLVSGKGRQFHTYRDAKSSTPSGISATGGSQTPSSGLEIDGYKYHFFTASSTPGFAVSDITGSGEIEYIVVAGGGGAGGYDGAYYDGGRGGDSTLTSPNSPESVTANGGGAGRRGTSGTTTHGGSGGGTPANIGYGFNPSTPSEILSPFGLPYPYTETQGYPTAPDYSGGGGAGEAGQPGNGPIPVVDRGRGGNGRTAFDGANIPTDYGTTGPTPGRWFAGGGGAGGGTPFIEAPGGAGGGGWGIVSPRSGATPPLPSAPSTISDTNGETNTGGGGGGTGTLPPASTLSGGGGAGGYLTGTLAVSTSPGAYPITIGGGGTGDSTKSVGGSGIVIIRYVV